MWSTIGFSEKQISCANSIICEPQVFFPAVPQQNQFEEFFFPGQVELGFGSDGFISHTQLKARP